VATPCEGQRLLQKFIEDRDLTKADFHRTLQARFGAKTPGYFTVNSWIVGKRRPGEHGQMIIQQACGIPKPAWLTEKELARDRWKQEQVQAADIDALEDDFGEAPVKQRRRPKATSPS